MQAKDAEDRTIAVKIIPWVPSMGVETKHSRSGCGVSAMSSLRVPNEWLGGKRFAQTTRKPDTEIKGDGGCVATDSSVEYAQQLCERAERSTAACSFVYCVGEPA